MWLLESRGREPREGYSTRGATVKQLLFTSLIAAARAAREARGLAHGRARGKGFPSEFLLN